MRRNGLHACAQHRGRTLAAQSFRAGAGSSPKPVCAASSLETRWFQNLLLPASSTEHVLQATRPPPLGILPGAANLAAKGTTLGNPAPVFSSYPKGQMLVFKAEQKPPRPCAYRPSTCNSSKAACPRPRHYCPFQQHG